MVKVYRIKIALNQLKRDKIFLKNQQKLTDWVRETKIF